VLPATYGLDLASVVSRQDNHIGRQSRYLCAKPLKGLHHVADCRKQWINQALLRKFDGGQPHFGSGHQRDTSAKRGGEQLMSKIKAEIGPSQLTNPSSDGILFRPELFPPDILWTVHDDEHTEVFQAKYHRAFVEFDDVVLPAAAAPDFSDRLRMLRWEILEYEDSQVAT
jgi:hypothetical protein